MQRVVTYNLADNFIEEFSSYLENNFIKKGRNLSKVAIVFGGKRPALFLKKELAAGIKKSFFPPRFFSIDEFVEYSFSKKYPFRKISDLEAAFVIYKLAQELSPDLLRERESFSKFLPWAREIVSFIEQLDLEDTKFDSLKGIQEKANIGYDVPESINLLLERIISLREAYHEEQKKKGVYSKGLIYLLTSQCMGDIDFSEFEEIIFCGFFYIHKTELAVIKSLYDANKALLFFQGSQDEWSVLERNSRSLSIVIKPENIKKPEYKLSVSAGFDLHSQVCLARDVLRGMQEFDKTVVVLPEPDHVISLLSEISGYVKDFNVSIGYPLKRSSLYSLFENIFKAQNNKKNSEYYAKDYLKVLSHPLVKNLRVLTKPSATRVLIHKIEEVLLGIEKTSLGGRLFFNLSDIEESRELFDSALKTMNNMDLEVSRDEIKTALKELHGFLFVSWEKLRNFYDFSVSLEQFLDLLVKKGFLAGYPLNLKMIEKIFLIRQELSSASFSKEDFPGEEIFKIFENKLENEMVSFSGSPLKGLQILGLFETRSLNFKNVVILDVNESVLPKLKIYEPLIPREVMISLGLNRLEKEEEIQRYQFMRLVASAKNVHLLFQKRPDKEKSRFIEEIIWEKQKNEKTLNVLEIPQASFKVKVLPKSAEVKKNSKVIRFLKEREYSASSINTYLNCPLRFYYQYVLGLKEKEDLLEEPLGKDIGTFVHELLKESFSLFIGKRPIIDSEFKNKFKADLDNRFKDEFEKKMRSDAFLIKEILDFRMEKFLLNEEYRPVKEILSLEKTFKGVLNLKSGNFKYKSIIDRVDLLTDNSILIIDYKTGSSDIMPSSYEKIASSEFTRASLKNTLKSVQLPLYLYSVESRGEFENQKINACLYSLRDMQKNYGLNMLFKNDAQVADRKNIMQVYIKAMDAILADVINPDVPFVADEEDNRQCETCPFFYMCR
ncbi:MAG: PD-(D/E)XK nuclease family protein [Candidatus Omnitrophica bacterium]|nr:PD-(D/E)XK nuclease family protein [Candidatus Omnitrophota bacterium]